MSSTLGPLRAVTLTGRVLSFLSVLLAAMVVLAAPARSAQTAADLPGGSAGGPVVMTAEVEVASTPATGLPQAVGLPPMVGLPQKVGLPPVAGPTLAAASGQVGQPRWRWPLNPLPRVARAFEAPPVRWAPGHRGLDLVGADGQDVLAVEDGVVSFVGSIAGLPMVTVTHSDGLRSTYQPVAATVRRGQPVTVGAVLGRLALTGTHCAPDACLHLGAVRGEDYLNPWPLLVRTPIVLLPLR